MMRLSAAFSSLSMDDNNLKSASTTKGVKTSHSSLPDISTGATGTLFISRPSLMRNYSHSVFDDDDTNDQPIDFSRKYPETNPHGYNAVKNYNSNFSMYAETDLDQPTDYSLRYAEGNLDTEDKIAKNEAPEFVQDTIKTYCTEDTPYETPFNFSTSTSMSDLRIDSTQKNEEVPVVAEKPTPQTKSEFSSGLMSPEKPVHSKNVKFEEVVNYAEETPLMFSRSSSLASLDSIEQHSIHDDRSSVLSDFSRLTSGLISPSDLPDSPTQTIPPSPRARKKVSLFNMKIAKPKVENQPPANSVFEDNVKDFKTESTPIQFSSATSLSNLTIDDFDKVNTSKEEPVINDESEEDQRIGTREENKNEEDTVDGELINSTNDQMQNISTAGKAENNSNEEIIANNLEEDDKDNVPLNPLEANKEENKTAKEGEIINKLEEEVKEDDEEDRRILATCIKLGMEYRWSQPKKKRSSKDSAAASSISTQENEGNGGNINIDKRLNEILKDNQELDEEEDKQILASCIRMGMEYRWAQTKKEKDANGPKTNSKDYQYVVNTNKQENKVDDDDEEDKRLLASCIKMGMEYRWAQTKKEKPTNGIKENSSNFKNMNNQFSPNETSYWDQEDETFKLLSEGEDDEELLATCIKMGMQYTQSQFRDKKGVFEATQNNGSKSKNKSFTTNKGVIGNLGAKLANKINESSFKLKRSIKKEKENKTLIDILSEDENEEDQALLSNCIQMGMRHNHLKFEEKNERRNINGPQNYQPTLKSLHQNPNTGTNGDSLRTYCTEDTPAILSHAGSHSDLSVLSINENRKSRENLSDIGDISDVENDIPIPKPEPMSLPSTSLLSCKLKGETKDNRDDEKEEEEEDKRILATCIRLGMEYRWAQNGKEKSSSHINESTGTIPKSSKHINQPSTGANLESSFSSTSHEDLESVLKQCILTGMMKNFQQKCTNKLTKTERILLEQCFPKGLYGNKQNDSRSVASSSNSLSKAERTLLQQCILSGMPKTKTTVKRRLRERPENGCCIHCPRNKNRVTQRLKKKTKAHSYGDVNTLYMANQIIILKKEILNKEEWI